MNRPALFGAWLLVLAAPADAADLQLQVLTAAGRPAGDVVVQVLPAAAWSPANPADAVPLVQKDIRFDPYVMAIPVGTTVRFVNRDTYDHHVRSLPGGPLGGTAPAKSFEFRLSAAQANSSTSADLRFDVPGSVVLGCHLHGSMRGHIYIATTPWVAVTDAEGRVTLKGMPDGAAELRVWHPDQLTEQPPQRLQLAGSATASATLNFSPRRRPTPRPLGG